MSQVVQGVIARSKGGPVELTGVRYHFGQVSTRAALELIAAAKARGLPVTCGVAVHHMVLNELDVGPYLTFRKVKPPLRAVILPGFGAISLISILGSIHFRISNGAVTSSKSTSL